MAWWGQGGGFLLLFLGGELLTLFAVAAGVATWRASRSRVLHPIGAALNTRLTVFEAFLDRASAETRSAAITRELTTPAVYDTKSP